MHLFVYDLVLINDIIRLFKVVAIRTLWKPRVQQLLIICQHHKIFYLQTASAFHCSHNAPWMYEASLAHLLGLCIRSKHFFFQRELKRMSVDSLWLCIYRTAPTVTYLLSLIRPLHESVPLHRSLLRITDSSIYAKHRGVKKIMNIFA